MNEYLSRVPKLLMLILFFFSVVVRAEERHLVVILDTSGSMTDSDPPRYTAQLGKIISDMTNNDDSMTVITLGGDSCGTHNDPSLAIRLDPARRPDFKSTLDSRVIYGGGNSFSVPIVTAKALLEPYPEKQRMLLIIADSGGLSCNPQNSDDLTALHLSGVHIAAINIGNTAGAFENNPAFDFTTVAPDSEGLVEAVALVYQEFLGSKKVQTGATQGPIHVEIAPFVKEAFLVVAGDGPVPSIKPNGNNPSAEKIELDRYGGGETTGLDRVTRGYRVVRLQKPAPGKWGFEIPETTEPAGWMLLQDSTLSVRFFSGSAALKGMPAQIDVEIYDFETGKRIQDSTVLTTSNLFLEAEGEKIHFQSNGDGTFSAEHSFRVPGKQKISAVFESETLNKSVLKEMEIVEGRWNIKITTGPDRVRVGSKVALGVELTSEGNPAFLIPPKNVDVSGNGVNISLFPEFQQDGKNSRPLKYNGSWVPEKTGSYELEYSLTDAQKPPREKRKIEVAGFITFGKALPITFGELEAQSEKTAFLDISNSAIRGKVDLTLSTGFKAKRSTLEIDLGKGWVPLGASQTPLHLSENGPFTWPARVRVGRCPGAVSDSDMLNITLKGKDLDEKPIALVVPLLLRINEESWIKCWWPVVAATAGVMTIAIILHGFVSPSRFHPRLGVLISPEEDINEGFFHPIHAEKGSGSGFYKDATIYVCLDYRLSSKKLNACARLRSEGKNVRIQTIAGNLIWRRTADGAWESIKAEEGRVRFGDLYKNDAGTVFFEVRNG